MSYLGNEVLLSKSTANKFSNIKQKTGITPNIMGRIALMKALESDVSILQLKSVGHFGQKIPRDIFFGNDEDVIGLSLEFYVLKSGYDGEIKDLVNMLVEYGAHSIPQIKSIKDLDFLI